MPCRKNKGEKYMRQTTSEASTKHQNQQKVSAPKGRMDRPFKSRKPAAADVTKEVEIKKGIRPCR